MNALLILPIVIPLAAAACSFVFWRRRIVQRAIVLAGAVSLLIAAFGLFESVRRGGTLAAQMGGWVAPFGITLVADLFSAIMVLLAATMNLCVTIYSLSSIDRRRETFGYFPLLQTLLMGVCGAFLTGDIFNLYVWFEVMLMASFVLLALGGERRQIEGAIQYVTINLLSSAILLAAIGLLYGVTGTLNFADLSVRVESVEPQGIITTLSILFLIAFGVKAAAFPLFFWLPASYHTPPVAVSAIFAGLLTKVGVYALARVFTLIFTSDTQFISNLILVVAASTMLAGSLAAIVQRDLRRLLSFLIIAHIGVALMGLGLGTERALAGMVFYLIEDIIVLTNLFLIAGIIKTLSGTETLAKLGGLYRTHPGFAVLFLIPALSLSGIPPFSGFFAKLALVQAAIDARGFVVLACSLLVSILTLAAMMRVWSAAFWQPKPAAQVTGQVKTTIGNQEYRLLVPVAALSILTVVLGFAAGFVFDVSTTAARSMMNKQEYRRAVFGSPTEERPR